MRRVILTGMAARDAQQAAHVQRRPDHEDHRGAQAVEECTENGHAKEEEGYFGRGDPAHRAGAVLAQLVGAVVRLEDADACDPTKGHKEAEEAADHGQPATQGRVKRGEPVFPVGTGAGLHVAAVFGSI